MNASNAVLSAQHEYGPFGEVLRATGPMAKANPFRFSTKYQDDETDLLYYGYRYYNASTGRWISRDPAEEEGGLSLYALADNNSVTGVDTLGLYKGHDHKELTKTAFEAVHLDGTLKLLRWMLKTLVDENLHQDGIGPGGFSFEDKRHYNRHVQPHGNVGQENYDRFGLEADDEYGDYLSQEKRTFKSSLESGGKNGCKEALKALGRISHSWQDFYMHAIRRDGLGGKENSYWPGWTAFSDGKSGSPDARGEFYPSSFSALATGKKSGEHPGWFREPILSSSPEWAPRYNGALDYTTKQYEVMLPEWMAKCVCPSEQ